MTLLAGAMAAIFVWALQQRSIEGEYSGNGPSTPRAADSVRPSISARGDLRALFSADDYPAAALANNEQGKVILDLAISARGRVEKCTVYLSSGHDRLDLATCRILTRRARFTPARGSDGKPVPDTMRTPSIEWRLVE